MSRKREVEFDKDKTKKPTKRASRSQTRQKPTKGTGSSHKGQQLATTWGADEMEAGWKMWISPSNTRSKSAIAEHFGIPKNTFMDRLNLLSKTLAQGGSIDGMFGVRSGGKAVPRIFTEQEEEELIEHVVDFAESGFPMTPKDVRNFTYDVAVANNILLPMGREELSKNWLQNFLERHPTLKLITPKEMSGHRAVAQDAASIDAWFDKFEALLKKNSLKDTSKEDGMYIWNVDETGINENPKSRKSYVERNSKGIQIVPNEKGETVTVLAFVNALGIKTSPMVIFKGKKVQDRWKEHMPNGYQVRVSETGWVDRDLFTDYGRCFVRALKTRGLIGKTKEGKEQKHILILDGHRAHSYNFEFLQLMKANDITVLGLPPHSTHYLQPLDQAPLAAFKRRYNQALHEFNRSKGGRAMSKAQFFEVMPGAWRESMTEDNIISGFRMTGLWPVDRKKINPSHLMPKEKICEQKHCAMLVLPLSLYTRTPGFVVFPVARVLLCAILKHVMFVV